MSASQAPRAALASSLHRSGADLFSTLTDDLLVSVLAALPADDRLLAREVAQRWRALITSRTAVWRRVDVASCSLGSSAMVCAALACMRVAVERNGGVAAPMELDCGDLYLSDELRDALRAAPPLAVLRIRTTSLEPQDELLSKAGVGALHCHLTVDPSAANLVLPSHVRVNLLTFRPRSNPLIPPSWPSVRTFLEFVRPTRVCFRLFRAPPASYLAVLEDVADLGVRGIYLRGCYINPQVAAALVRAAPRELWLEEIACENYAIQHMVATIRQLCQDRRLERFAFSFCEARPENAYEPEWSLAVAGALTDVPHVTYLGTESRPCNGNNSVTAALLSNPGIRSLCSTLARLQPVLSALQGNHALTELHLKLANTEHDYTSDCLGPLIRLLSAAAAHNSLSNFGMAFGDADLSDGMVERGAFVGAVAGLIRCRRFERLTLDGVDVVSLGADEWSHIFDAIRSPTSEGQISFSFMRARQSWEVTGENLVNLFDQAMADRRHGPHSFELDFHGFVCPKGWSTRERLLRLRSERFLLRSRRFGAYGFKEAYQYESWRWE